MIKELHLQNFKNHSDTCIRLGRLTTLAGPNSAGKTSILEALDCLHQLGTKASCNGIFSGTMDPDTLARFGEHHLAIHLAGKEHDGAWSVDVSFSKAQGSENHRNDHEDWQPKVQWKWNNQEDEIDSWNSVPFVQSAGRIPDILERIVFLKAVGKNLSTPSYTEDIPPRLSSDGTNLASLIAYLRTTEPERLKRLETHLKSVVPSVEGVRTRPRMIPHRELRSLQIENTEVSFSEERKLRADELLFDMVGAKSLPAHAVGEGTLIATGLLAALLGTDQREPRLLLIDDIEQGLHPKAQRDLVAVLRKILDTYPKLQILLTTHSPYIIDEMEARETWLLATDENGIARTKRLSEHPDANRALGILTTGEFWSAEGEEWVVENT